MNDTINTFPVDMQILGRVLNANGEPVDKKGSLANEERVSIPNPLSVNVESEVNEGKVPPRSNIGNRHKGLWVKAHLEWVS